MTKRIRSAAALHALGGLAAATLVGRSSGPSAESDGKVAVQIGDRPGSDPPEDPQDVVDPLGPFRAATPHQSSPSAAAGLAHRLWLPAAAAAGAEGPAGSRPGEPGRGETTMTPRMSVAPASICSSGKCASWK